MLAPTDQAAQQDSNAERNRKQKERDVERSRSGKAVAARVTELEALAERGPLTVEQEVELAELQLKVAQQKQKQKERKARYYRSRKAVAARVVELEALKEQGPLTVEQEVELAELQPKVAQQKEKQKERNARYYRSRKAAAARVAVLEELAEQGPLTVEQEAELAELQPKVAQQQKEKEMLAERSRARRAAVDRVAVLEELAEQGPLTVEQEVELAELQPKAQQWQKQKEYNAEYRREGRAAVDRVAVLEELAEQGPLTVEQEVELAELQPKVAQQKQKQRERKAEYRREGRAAVDRVAVLEELAEQGPLTVEQEVELAELQPKVAQQKQKQRERKAEYRREGRAAVDRVAVLEELAEQGPLTVEQEVELAELQPKAQQWQKRKEWLAEYGREGRAAVDRVAVLEELAEQGPLTVEQEVELAELQPKAQQWQKRKEWLAEYRREGRAAVDRVAVLEELAEQGPLTVEQEAELAELQPKAQQKQKQKERNANNYRSRKAAADRFAVLEALKERGPLTEELAVELAELRSKVAGRGRKKQDREVTETGVGGAPVVGRGAGLEGVSGWSGADHDGRDVWSADVDLDAWFARVVPDVDGVQVPQGAVDAGVMLGGGADGEFVATELPAFLGPDAVDDAAVAGGLISPVSSPTTPRGRVPLGCLGVKALTVCFSVSRLRGMRCGLPAGVRWGLGCGGFRSGSGG